MKTKGLIYVLKDPVTKEIRYIGQTKQSLKSRLSTHIYDAVNRRFNAPKCCWIRKLIRNSMLPIIENIEETDINLLNSREIYWIAYYRSLIGNKLLNLTDGGNGVCLTIKQYHRRTENKKVYLINRYSLERKEINSTKEAACFLNVNRGNIPKAIHIKGECNGYYVSYSPFDINWLPPKNKREKPVLLTDVNGKEYSFKNRNKAIEFTKGTYIQHKNGAISAIKNGHFYRGYYWKI